MVTENGDSVNHVNLYEQMITLTPASPYRERSWHLFPDNELSGFRSFGLPD
jgi:hypothetical protein